LSQGSIKNNERLRFLRTVIVVIENRHPLPLHLRDLLLLAAADAEERGTVAPGVLDGVDPIDTIALAARMVQCQLQALTANLRSVEARHMLATEVFATAQSLAADTRAVGAAGTVVGAVADGELATAAAIANALATFEPAELVDAAVALCAASLRVLADAAATSVAEIVAWSAGDAPTAAPAARPALRPARAAFCGRDAVVTSGRGAAHSR
jgi:hypothetical protein